MLIHPWDAALDEEEWRQWLADGHDFGALAVNGPGNLPPVVIPTHFAIDGDHLLVHLARTNPVWSAIEARPNVLMSVVDDYAFIPSTLARGCGRNRGKWCPNELLHRRATCLLGRDR